VGKKSESPGQVRSEGWGRPLTRVESIARNCQEFGDVNPKCQCNLGKKKKKLIRQK